MRLFPPYCAWVAISDKQKTPAYDQTARPVDDTLDKQWGNMQGTLFCSKNTLSTVCIVESWEFLLGAVVT